MSEIKNTNELVKEIYGIVVEGGGTSEDILYIKNKVDTIEGDVEDQTNGLTAIKSDTGGIKSSIEDQSTGLSAIKSDTASIKSDLEDPTTGIVETNGEVKSIKSVIESYSGGVGIVSEISRGKTIISDAINTKGGSTHPYDSYSTLATAIENLPGPGVLDSTGVTSIDNLSVPFLSWWFTDSGHTSQSRNIDTINDNTITSIDYIQPSGQYSSSWGVRTLGARNVTMSALTSITKPYTFYYDDKLTSFSAPNLTQINAPGVFHDCTNLTSVNLPELQVLYPAGQMFYNCSSLQSITLPKLDRVLVSSQLFYNCTSLESVSFPVVKYLDGSNLFDGCTSLKTFSAPSLFGTVGEYAFQYCTNLESVEFGKVTTGTWYGNVFGGTGDNRTKLRDVKVGSGTTMEINLIRWTATDVINEGQSGIDELNQNLHDHLLANLQTYSSGTHTLVLGWLPYVTQSNIDYATSKGWTLSN